MSSVSSSVDVSKLLQALTGSTSSGLDVSTLVTASVYAARAPQRQWQTDQKTLQTENSLLSQFSSATTSLYDSMSSLSDPIGVMNSLSAKSSNSSIVSASVQSGAVAGTHLVKVSQLSKTASWYTDSISEATASALPSGSFQIHAAGGKDATVTVGGDLNTLDKVASYINDQKLGVSASVIHDSQGARLAIVSSGSGAAKDFTIDNVSLDGNGAPFIGFNHNAGQDASVEVDGIPITSATNTVTGALTGVTLNLASAAKDTEVTLSINPDTASISQTISGFVSQYNSLVSAINTQFKYDSSSSTSGALAGDSTIRMLQSDLLSAMGYTTDSSNAGTITNISALGLTMNKDGTLELDSAQLSNALTNNLSEVRNFLQGDASNGFANTFKNALNSYSDTTDGAFTVDIQNNKNQIDDLQDNIDGYESYITDKQAYWTDQYSKAAAALLQLPQQLKQLDAMLGNGKNS